MESGDKNCSRILAAFALSGLFRQQITQIKKRLWDKDPTVSSAFSCYFANQKSDHVEYYVFMKRN